MKTAILSWLKTLEADWHVVALNDSPFQKSLEKFLDENRSFFGTDVEALLWLRLGLIERSHQIVQDGRRGLQAYIHSVVHRMEGDYWNSKYWIRQVQDRDLLQAIGQSILGALEANHVIDLAKDSKLVHQSQFRFEAMVDACEEIMKDTTSSEKDASVLGYVIEAEWLRLIEIAIDCPS